MGLVQISLSFPEGVTAPRSANAEERERSDTMKLGILVTIINNFGQKGFYHSQEVGLGKALNELGHDVTIYKCVAKDQKEDRLEINEHLRTLYLPVPSLGVHGYLRTDRLDPSLDGLLAFADTQIFLPHIYKWCEKNHVCFVPYLGIAHSSHLNLKSRFMDAFYAMGTKKIYYNIPLLVKTDTVKEEMKSQGVTNCTVTPVGLDETELKTDFRQADRTALREKYGYTDGDLIISFVGRMEERKRPLDMIDIFDAVKDIGNAKLLMVGEGDQQQQVAEKVRSKGLESRVQMIPKVPYDSMWEIHYISDFFVNLMTWEIFGMALLEAVFYESAVIASEAPGPDFILKGLEGHTICKSDEEIIRKLRQPRPDAAVLEESSKALLRRFSWKHCAEAFVNITANKMREQSHAVQL